MPFLAYSSPVGALSILEENGAIAEIRFTLGGGGVPPEGQPSDALAPATPLLAEAARELDRYFTGSLESFELPLAPRGTQFQLAVWKALLAIPYGDLATYGEIARAAGSPLAARAVGMACNRNPIAIVIPCHRVIGASGALVGYAGGIEAKRLLLALEASRQPHLL